MNEMMEQCCGDDGKPDFQRQGYFFNVFFH